MLTRIAADFQGNEMVLLIMGHVLVIIAVFVDLLPLQLICEARRGTYRTGGFPIGIANRLSRSLWRHIRIGKAWCPHGIGQQLLLASESTWD